MKFTIRKMKKFQLRAKNVQPFNAQDQDTTNHFRYASISKRSKYKCRSCGAHIQRHGIRRMLLCPLCQEINELN